MYVGLFCVDFDALCRHDILRQNLHAYFVVWIRFIRGFGVQSSMRRIAMDDI
jgi:hypothetical protein